MNELFTFWQTVVKTTGVKTKKKVLDKSSTEHVKKIIYATSSGYNSSFPIGILAELPLPSN